MDSVGGGGGVGSSRNFPDPYSDILWGGRIVSVNCSNRP